MSLFFALVILLDKFPIPPSSAEEGGTARRVARMEARNFAVRPGKACLQSAPGATRRAREFR